MLQWYNLSIMSSKPKKKSKTEKDDDDWLYDPVIEKYILESSKEVDEAIKKGKKLISLEDLLEKFHKEDAKRIQD